MSGRAAIKEAMAKAVDDGPRVMRMVNTLTRLF